MNKLAATFTALTALSIVATAATALPHAGDTVEANQLEAKPHVHIRNSTITNELQNFDPEAERQVRTQQWRAAQAAQATVSAPEISYDRVMMHLKALQKIADDNNGDRSHGRPGFLASINYVKKFLDDAGFDVTIQEFQARGATGYNLIADLPGGNEDRTVIVGAHLDSVPDVAAISDNASGSAGILEVALEAAKAKRAGVTPQNHMRFIWFGAEELAMVGSAHYVKNMPWSERLKVLGYLNYDMIASPNPGFFLLDGDDSDGKGFPAGPPGSAYLEKVHEEYFQAKGVPTRGWDVDGIMDYGPFMDARIAVGGLATGASSRMTEEQARLWNGDANKPFDACYHRACDDINNLDHDALKLNSQAIGYVVWKVAGMTGGANPTPTETTGPKPEPTVTATAPEPTDAPAVCEVTDNAGVAIPDLSQVSRTVELSCNKKPSERSRITLDIDHTYRSDLVVTLTGPSGRNYDVYSSGRDDSGDDLKIGKILDLSRESARGSWTLVVKDKARQDVGTLNQWKLSVGHG